LHNAVRNTLLTLLSTLAPLAGLVRSKFNILLKPTNLLPQHPLRRPANVAVWLNSLTKAHLSTLAINGTITPVPSHLPSQSHSNQPTNLLEAHLFSIHTKLSGRTHGTLTNRDVIATINQEKITLLPFTVNHLEGLGFFAHTFLFSKDPPFAQPPLPNLSEDRLPHPPKAVQAFQTLWKSPPNHAWQESKYRRLWFGSTYHTAPPQQWELQCLSLSISNVLGRHLLHVRAAVAAAAQSSASQPPSILGPTFYQSTPYIPL
jgi:hypothetical protein